MNNNEIIAFDSMTDEMSYHVENWCRENKKGVSTIILPKAIYRKFRREALSTKLGRGFLRWGFKFFNADVYSYSGHEIVFS